MENAPSNNEASSGTSALNDGLGAEMPDKESDTNRTGFRAELETLINSHSKENGSDTPDFILADYMADCLDAYDRAVTRRMEWYRPALKDTPNASLGGAEPASSAERPSRSDS